VKRASICDIATVGRCRRPGSSAFLQGALPERLAAVFMPLLMLVLGVFLANIGWWIGRRDVEYISRRIREALSSGGTEPPNEPDGKRSAVGIG
jgi:sulfite exporter TauE/SafE